MSPSEVLPWCCCRTGFAKRKPKNATPLGLEFVKVDFLENTELPMLVTVKPLVVLGIVNAPPDPVYLLILSEPSLLVVKMNWACTTTGNASKSRSDSSLAAKARRKPWRRFCRAPCVTNFNLSFPSFTGRLEAKLPPMSSLFAAV